MEIGNADDADYETHYALRQRSRPGVDTGWVK